MNLFQSTASTRAKKCQCPSQYLVENFDNNCTWFKVEKKRRYFF